VNPATNPDLANTFAMIGVLSGIVGMAIGVVIGMLGERRTLLKQLLAEIVAEQRAREGITQIYDQAQRSVMDRFLGR
jgi:ABC-type lipoprotein release transport system permease subunit